MKKCVVIGGGIIGLCSAYYLQKEGYEVTVVDQSNLDEGASYVNAGYISPSHIIPLSAPGVIKKGIKWMFDPSSPFYIKPRMDVDFLKWIWAFNKSCTNGHVKRSIPVIRDISLLSENLYLEMRTDNQFDSHYEKKGLLMLCNSQKTFEEELSIAEVARRMGLDAIDLNEEQVKELEPDIKLDIVGATLYRCDSHTTPHEFMSNLKNYLGKQGVNIIKKEKVIDLKLKEDRIVNISTDRQTIEADEFVLAAGSWTGMISKKLGINILLQAGKGYRIDVFRPTGISMPAILAEAKAAVTPMNGFTRFAGTMEIAGINSEINPVRVEAIAKAVKTYYPEIVVNDKEKRLASSGLRPVSADGLPYIGQSDKCQNLTFATGHAMMGWTMGAGTGKLVSELVHGQKTSMNVAPFHPDRKF